MVAVPLVSHENHQKPGTLNKNDKATQRGWFFWFPFVHPKKGVWLPFWATPFSVISTKPVTKNNQVLKKERQCFNQVRTCLCEISLCWISGEKLRESTQWYRDVFGITRIMPML